jgi:DNA-binding HxlR family transcriptional regulator
MALLDLLGRRWALRVLWELRAAPLTFRALASACGEPSPTVLNDRLKELRASGLVTLDFDRGYGLTRLGAELVTRFGPLVTWAERWARTNRGAAGRRSKIVLLKQ